MRSVVLVMSDTHYGKRTPTFDHVVCERRLRNVSRVLKTMKQVFHSADELVIYNLGDANDGSDIYPSQASYQSVTSVEEQAYRLAEIYAELLVEQAQVWQKVRMESVCGNHGRSGKRMHEAANWDLVLYEYTALMVQKLPISERVEVVVPERQQPWVRLSEIRGWRYLLYHGHDIRSYSNIPWYGIFTRLARWTMDMGFSDWRVALMGHFHTAGRWEYNGRSLILNGTMITDDQWAFRTLGWKSVNGWWLFSVTPFAPVEWMYLLPLEGENDGTSDARRAEANSSV